MRVWSQTGARQEGVKKTYTCVTRGGGGDLVSVGIKTEQNVYPYRLSDLAIC